MRILLLGGLSLGVLLAGAVRGDEPAAFHAVQCEGIYPQHLQGVCISHDSIYWCFTTQLVKTSRSGKVQKQITVRNHHGDLCFHDGKVFVAVNLGQFNQAAGGADSWIYVYNADDLSLIARHAVPEVIYGAGGIAFHKSTFLVVGGLPADIEENHVYAYDEQLNFLRKHVLKSGQTLRGIQTAAFADGCWWFGCYGNPAILLKANEPLTKVERFEMNCSLGIVPLASGKFLVARGTQTKGVGHTGRLVLAETDQAKGLALKQ